MSPIERPVPPAGEGIHLPGGSLQPILLTLGITFALVGITVSFALLAFGLVLTAVTLAVWIRDAVHEFEELPADHHPVSHDTAPIEQPGPTRATSEG